MGTRCSKLWRALALSALLTGSSGCVTTTLPDGTVRREAQAEVVAPLIKGGVQFGLWFLEYYMESQQATEEDLKWHTGF